VLAFSFSTLEKNTNIRILMSRVHLLNEYEKSDTISKWRLWQYRSPNGRCAIDDWRKCLSVGAPRADFDTFMRDMVKLHKWEPPDFEPLHGQQSGFQELRWKSAKVQHRILGYIVRDREFGMLIGCTHKESYDPPDALTTLLKRKSMIDAGEASLVEYRLILNR